MSNLKDSWNKIFSQNTWGEYPAEDLVRFFARHKNLSKKNLLEIGCGPGGNLQLYRNKKINFTGNDISKVAIDRAKKKFPISKSCKYIVGDIRNTEFGRNKFDIFIDNCASCCISFEERQSFYNTIYFSLKKNGLIFLRTFTNKCVLEKSKKIKSNEFYEPKKILTGVGKINFISEIYLKKLFLKKYKIIFLEEISRTLGKQKNLLSEWIVHAKKI